MAKLKKPPKGMKIDTPVNGAAVIEVEGRQSHPANKTSFRTTRTAVHKGKQIRIHTTYRIEIDGEPLSVHVSVDNDGTVHCHGLPNYSFGSAVDMARALIEASALARYSHDELGQAQGGHAHGEGGHH